MNDFFKGKKILVTGGTGSVGSELIKSLVKEDIAVLRVIDVDETKQFEMKHELKNYDSKLRFLLGDIRDLERMKRALEGIDIVFHCAALKHVMACEYNSFEAVKTNILGTQNVIEAAIDNEIEKMIVTSSDKAVNPSNVMGSTKLVAEKLMTSANFYKGNRKTCFSTVRFGNVFGSRGSVVPHFYNQIKNGGPVTIHDPKMTRFVMSMQQTLKLVFKATEIAQGGEVFTLKMPSVAIPDLAQTMIEKYAKDPSKIKTKITAPVAGEKIHEELMTEDEAKRALETDDMFVIMPEMKELLPSMDKAKYNAKEAKVTHYDSADWPKLDKAGILKMLSEISP